MARTGSRAHPGTSSGTTHSRCKEDKTRHADGAATHPVTEATASLEPETRPPVRRRDDAQRPTGSTIGFKSREMATVGGATCVGANGDSSIGTTPDRWSAPGSHVGRLWSDSGGVGAGGPTTFAFLGNSVGGGPLDELSERPPAPGGSGAGKCVTSRSGKGAHVLELGLDGRLIVGGRHDEMS